MSVRSLPSCPKSLTSDDYAHSLQTIYIKIQIILFVHCISNFKTEDMMLKIHNKSFLIFGWIAAETGLYANNKFSNFIGWSVLFLVGIVLMSLSVFRLKKLKLNRPV